MAKKKSLGQLQAQCDAWNAKHAVGTVVDVTKDLGDVVRTKTRSVAQVLSGHTPVIWLDGITGCYLLERVKAVDQANDIGAQG